MKKMPKVLKYFLISSRDFVFKTVKQQSGLLVLPRAKIRKKIIRRGFIKQVCVWPCEP